MSTPSLDLTDLLDRVKRLESSVNTVPLYQLPPMDVDTRVPAAENVELVSSQPTSGATKVALRWAKPTDGNIDHFEIWVKRTAFQSEAPYMVASTQDSPAAFTVTTDQDTAATAFIRTVMKGGLGTDLNASPTISFNVYKFVADSADIKDGAITDQKFDRVSVNRIAIGTADIQNAAITNAKIANLAVNTAQIQNAAITNALIANAAIDDAKISDLSAAKITAGALIAGVIYSGTINAAQINAGTITSVNLVSGTLTLNANGVTTTVNNAFDAASGSNFVGLKVIDNVNAWYTAVTPIGVYVVGATGSGSLTLVGSGGTQHGSLQLYHANGNQIVLNPDTPRVLINGTKVLGTQETGPGNPSFASFAAVQTWCQNLLTALRNHGLVT